MARRQPVPTKAILREIRKALTKLRAKRKRASPEQRKAIDLEMKVLKCSYRPIHDIWLG
jgi:hypothetical protein